MGVDGHRNPLAPASRYGRSDEEYGNIRLQTPQNHQKPTDKRFIYVLLAVVLFSIAFLIFGLAFLRIETPSIRLSRVSVSNLLNDTASLNVTMIASVLVRNRNFGTYRFHGGSVTLVYDNTTIGTGSIFEGSVGRRSRREINVTVGVISSQTYDLAAINSTTNFTRDVGSGLVNLRSFAELRGQVRAMRIMNRHRRSFMNCSMALNLTSQAIQNLSCQ